MVPRRVDGSAGLANRGISRWSICFGIIGENFLFVMEGKQRKGEHLMECCRRRRLDCRTSSRVWIYVSHPLLYDDIYYVEW